jgi:Na+/H+ antiporter NhaD/arsenite permease-like protein
MPSGGAASAYNSGILRANLSPAVLSLLALAVALALSMVTEINVGWLAIAFAWLIGVYVAGLRADAIMAGFPVPLFLTLAGVTLLFAIAETNGSLATLANRAMRRVRGSTRALPVLLFFIAGAISSVGPGAISTVALLAPIAMAMGRRVGLPAFLVALMIANGANAGNLSPFSSVGVIANGAMAKAGLAGYEGRVWFANFVTHVLVSAVAFVWLARRQADANAPTPDALDGEDATSFTSSQRTTLVVITLWIAGVVLAGWNLGLSAFTAAAVLVLVRAGDERAALRAMPWGIIMMVCGVSVLIGMLEKTGGMDLFTAVLAKFASPATVNGVIAFVAGAISTYSSTSGVVMPAFLPTSATLVERLGGGDPLAVALSINVGSSLVDVSPLSTIGALCVAAVADAAESRLLFRRLMIWGLSMILVGAAICQLFAGTLARASFAP